MNKKQKAAAAETAHRNTAIEQAVGFTTARFRGRGEWDKREFATFADAVSDARGDRRAMIYAIQRNGSAVHVGNGDDWYVLGEGDKS